MTPAATATVDAQPQELVRVGLKLLCSLIAARATFRLVLYGANIALLTCWGAGVYGRYAAASGVLLWVMTIAQAGPEKAALKLIPRGGDGRAAMLTTLRFIIRLAPLALLVPAVLAIALAPRGTGALYAAAAAQGVALGLNMAAVAVQRALGRTGRDLVNFGLLSIIWVVLTAVTVALAVAPVLYLLCLCLSTMTVTELTMRGTPVTPSGTHRSRALRSLGETAAMMSVYDVAGNAALSVAFLVLPLSGHADQSGVLYLALAGWGLALSLIVYVARVFQPRLSVWLAGAGSVSGRRQARVLARWALRLNLAWLAAAAVVIAVADLSGLTAGASAVAGLSALILSRSVIWGLMFASISLLENSDHDALRAVAKGAAAGLVVVVAVSAVVIPAFGAAGAIWAMATDELALAIAVLSHTRRS